MGFTQDDFDRLPDRLKPESERRTKTTVAPGAVLKELPLHDEIIKFCNDQWPRWLYVHSNPTAPATVRPGTPDFIVFAPGGVTLIVECKAKDGKLSPEQLAWEAEARRVGHRVHVVRSLAEFLDLAKSL